MAGFDRPRSPHRVQRVLIVDDDPDTRELLRRICADLGADADQAEDLRGALERAQAGVPDLVLLDMVLPDGAGLELLESFRGNTALEQVPAIVAVALRGDQQHTGREDPLHIGAAHGAGSAPSVRTGSRIAAVRRSRAETRRANGAPAVSSSSHSRASSPTVSKP